jgi:HlyD family secretion protein
VGNPRVEGDEMNRAAIFKIAFAAASLGAGIALVVHHHHATPVPAQSASYIASATRGAIDEIIASTGSVVSSADCNVKCRACGQVTRLAVDIGDIVKKGDVLLQLDPSDAQGDLDAAAVALDEARHKLSQAQDTLKQAQADLQIALQQADDTISSARVKATNLDNKANRQKQLLAQALSSQEEYEMAQTDAAQSSADLENAVLAKEQLRNHALTTAIEKEEDIETAADQVKADEVALKNAQQKLKWTTVVAPIDGVVSDLRVAADSVICPAGDPGGETVMTLSDLSRIYVNASVDEKSISGVRPGQKADIVADSYPSQHFSGNVVRIAPTGVTTASAVTFAVKIEVTGPGKDLLKPGMTAAVKVIEQSRDNAVLVPSAAVIHRQDKSFVMVVTSPGHTEARPVEVGIGNPEKAEVVSGLTGSERILVRRESPSDPSKSSAVELSQTTAD